MTDKPEDTMTPRDWFAAAALQGLLAGGSASPKRVDGFDEEMVRGAYKYADAMMKQRQGARDEG